MALVTAWNTREKRWVNVPEHWVGHPRLGTDLSLEKPASAGKGGGKAAHTTKEKDHAEDVG